MSTFIAGADGQDDCYHSELQAMINVIDGKSDSSTLLSSYADAAESYKLVSFLISSWTLYTDEQTWQIRLAGERSYKARGGNPHIVDIEGI
jgi:hypothetical protein